MAKPGAPGLGKTKGHDREIELTVDAMRRGGCSPIPFEELVEVSEATLAIEEAIARGITVQPNRED